jgi:uncharacterized protein
VNERLPSEEMALKLLFESGCSRKVINHCKAVEKVATEIAEACRKRGLNVDMKLVQIGALLHDIGRSKTHSVHHAIVGAEIARSLNLPEPVISIIERHVGGGITTEEAENLGWPVKSYVPETLEEKIVTYADKLIEGSERVTIEQTIKKFSRKLPSSSINGMRKLHKEIISLTGDFDAGSHVA